MATTLALKGANPAYFPNVNEAGMPVLNQKALDALLTKYKSNSLNAGQYRDNYNKFGWNVMSDGSSVLHGPAIFGLDMGNIPAGSMGSFTRGIVKAGTNTAATPKEFQTAATQLGLKYSDYVKPTAFVATPGAMGSIEKPTAKNTKQYTDPATGKSYLARIDAKGNYVTKLDETAIYNAINDKSKDLYMVANALDRTGVGANKKAPHASVLFRADGSGNLLPVTLPTGEIAATPYQAVGVSHAGWQGQLAELAPLIGFAALAVGAPYLSSLFSGGAAAGSSGLTAGLTAGQVSAAGGAAAGAAGAATAGAIAMPTLTQIGAAMLEGSLISGGIAAVTGGDIGRAMLTGALTGGASSYVSGALATGALGSIAQNFSAMGNAMATGAIVSAGEAALTGQPWLKAGLIGGASSGIMYAAADWAKDAFSKPAGAKPGTMVVDKNGNVVQIDADGKGVFQPDMFAAVGDNQTITIADKAGNIVNSTNPDMPISPVYDDAISVGAKPPTVGLSQTGEIDGIAGTATYYTNGETSWTPFNNQAGVTSPYGTADLIPSSTPIKSEVIWDNGVPKIQQVTASGSSSVGNMSNTLNTQIAYNGMDGSLQQFTYGDEVVYAFKPTGATNAAPVDLTDDFAQGFVDSKGNFVDSTGSVRSNLNNNYVDSAGQVYDAAGNPVAKLASAISTPNTANVDWSGILKDNGTIARTNGDLLDAATGTFANGALQGQIAEAGKYSTPGAQTASSVTGTVTTPPTTPEVTAPTTPVTPDVPAQPTPSYVDQNGMGYDAMGNPVAPAISETPTTPAQYTQPVNVAPVVNNVPTGFSQEQAARLMNTNLAKTGSLDVNSVNQFVAQGYTPDQIIQAIDNNPNGGWANYNTGIRSMNPGAVVAPTVPVAPPVTQPTATQPVTPEVPVTQPTATQPTTPTQPTAPISTPGYVDTANQVYDYYGNPVGPAGTNLPRYVTDYNNIAMDPVSRTLGGSLTTMSDGTQVFKARTAGFTYTKVPGSDSWQFAQEGVDPLVTISPPKTTTPTPPTTTPPVDKPYVDQSGNLLDSQGKVVDNFMNNYVDKDGVVYDDLGNPAGQLQGTKPGTNVDYSGMLQPGGIIKTTQGGIVNVNTGTVAPPATQPIEPSVPGSNYVDSSGTMYDQYGNPTKDVSGNYVDNAGTVYDEFGNPAGSIAPGTTTVPGADLSGTLNNNGTITKPDGSVIDYSGVTVAPPGTVTQPTTPDYVPPKPVDPVTAATAGVIAGQAATTALATPETKGKGYTLNWGTPPTINLPGVNPGTYAQAVKPYYTQGTPIQSQYYWGKHPYAATEADLANYNNIPGAPAQPFGAQFSAVGGNRQLNINDYISQYMNPQYQTAYLGSQPQYAGIAGTTTNIPAASVGPVTPSAMSASPMVQQAAPVFAAPQAMSVNLTQGVPQQVSIPTWTKEGGLYYAMPTPAPVAP